ncbi:hypothetical protein BDY21DRAFT_211262 [Lineolata rhizophorae]|uniref:Uncharacterized protein n=1 Tax=Lineolata rhizophorae TaxID=578093 RepID=A0A6A6P5N9_9PEZI|nr:hypothetical protein BDY21DRAFT_211262 [Lineolata rhizophorae]
MPLSPCATIITGALIAGLRNLGPKVCRPFPGICSPQPDAYPIGTAPLPIPPCSRILL